MRLEVGAAFVAETFVDAAVVIEVVAVLIVLDEATASAAASRDCVSGIPEAVALGAGSLAVEDSAALSWKGRRRIRARSGSRSDFMVLGA